MLSNVAPAPEEPKTVDCHFMIYPPAYAYSFVVLCVGLGRVGGSCLLWSFGSQKYLSGGTPPGIYLHLMMGFCDIFLFCQMKVSQLALL